MNKNTTNQYGKLTYSDQAEYVLQTSKGIVNISKIFDDILNTRNSNKYVEVKVMNGCKLLFQEEGNIMKYDSYTTGVTDYHINGCCLGDILFNNCDSFLDMEIYAPKIALDYLQNGEVGYGREQTSSCVK